MIPVDHAGRQFDNKLRIPEGIQSLDRLDCLIGHHMFTGIKTVVHHKGILLFIRTGGLAQFFLAAYHIQNIIPDLECQTGAAGIICSSFHLRFRTAGCRNAKLTCRYDQGTGLTGLDGIDPLCGALLGLSFQIQHLTADHAQSTGSGAENLHGLSDPLYDPPPADSRLYSGVKHEDVTQHAIDGRRMILKHIHELRAQGDEGVYPILIPTYDGMRMTRRLDGAYVLDEKEVFVDFPDSIGLTGDWRNAGPVFSVPWRTIAGTQNANLAAAGRCISVTTDMWDITRVIPTAAMTGQAAGTGAALCAKTGTPMGELPMSLLQGALRAGGAIIEKVRG